MAAWPTGAARRYLLQRSVRSFIIQDNASEQPHQPSEARIYPVATGLFRHHRHSHPNQRNSDKNQYDINRS